MKVRRLSEGEAVLARHIRLQALADAPDAFGSTYEGEKDRPLDDWKRWFSNRAVFIAEDAEGEAVGIVSGVGDMENPTTAHLTSMWVHPAVRGTGAADALVQAVIGWASDARISSLDLDVAATNDRARRLYTRNGFVLTGVEILRERDGALELEMRRAAP